MKQIISGQDLIDAGQHQGKWFREAIDLGNGLLQQGASFEEALKAALTLAPPPPPPTIGLQNTADIPLHFNIQAENEDEVANILSVRETMATLLETPVTRAGAIMPDACPAGPKGTIPVGGVVVSEAIHPGMHSADICCSMAISIFDDVDPAALLDAVHNVTHFGPGGRERGKQIRPSEQLLGQFDANEYLKPIISTAIEHFATQGDGNHFAYVGTMKSTGQTALVTHHGSRAPGARLYKAGMKVADQFRRRLSPKTLPQNSWIPADTKEGENYWEALQLIRDWTKANHFAIHDMAAKQLLAKVADRFWNEHNFVFRRTDGLFYHAKGATPAFKGWAEDATDLTLVPLNMTEPVLLLSGNAAENGLGFAPHGAGRNFSRTQHRRRMAGRTDAEIFAEETKDIDARFFSGNVDISELPSAYKNATAVRRQIEHYGLGTVVDEVLPFGCIMAGDWESTAPWRRKKKQAATEVAP